MPIFSPISILPIDQDAFAQIDYHVMCHAFDSQNQLGRLCDEVIYQNDLTPQSRKRLEFQTERWAEDEEMSRILCATMSGLLEDRGGFLDVALYTEALIHFLGGEEKVSQLVPLSRNSVPLGNQRFHLLTP